MLERIRQGVLHVRRADPVIGRVIDHVGPCGLRLEKDRFRALVRSIISQQISGRAAESIFRRLLAAAGSRGRIAAAGLVGKSVDELRAAGISPQKALYLLDLAERVTQGELRLARVSRLPDEAVVEELIQVKGVGVWTAHMFLIFSLGRLNVFPYGDLGVRVALRDLYQLDDLPDRPQAEKIAAAWAPFATIGSWYCWRSLEAQTPSPRDRAKE